MGNGLFTNLYDPTTILTQQLNQIHWSNRFVKNVMLIFWEFYSQNSGLIF